MEPTAYCDMCNRPLFSKKGFPTHMLKRYAPGYVVRIPSLKLKERVRLDNGSSIVMLFWFCGKDCLKEWRNDSDDGST